MVSQGHCCAVQPQGSMFTAMHTSSSRSGNCVQQADESRPTCLHNVAEDLCVGVRVRAKAGLGLQGKADTRRVSLPTRGKHDIFEAALSTGIDGCSTFMQTNIM